MPARRLLVIAHDRSGSNLLKGMLNQHPEVRIVPALPVFEILYHNLGAYGVDTRRSPAEQTIPESRWDEFLEDAADLVRANHHPLPVTPTRAEIERLAEGRARTLGGVCDALYDAIAGASGRPVGGYKFGGQSSLIRPFLTTTRFTHAVFQYRDPRDVALSVWKAGVNRADPAEFAAYWAKWHREVRATLADAGIPCVEHAYETLLADPVATLDRVWDLLGVPSCGGAVLHFHESEDQRRAASTSYMWANTAKPLMTRNAAKFYTEFSRAEVARIEAALAGALAEFGYAPADPALFPEGDRPDRPEPRVRTEADAAFQREQHAVAERIRRKRAERGG